MTKTKEQQANEMHYHLLRIWGIELPSIEHSEYKFVNGDLHVKASFNMLEVMKKAYFKYCFYKCTPTFEHIATSPTHYVLTIEGIMPTRMPPVLTYLASRGISAITIDMLTQKLDDKRTNLISLGPTSLSAGQYDKWFEDLLELLEEGEIVYSLPNNMIQFTHFNGKPIIPSDLLKSSDIDGAVDMTEEELIESKALQEKLMNRRPKFDIDEHTKIESGMEGAMPAVLANAYQELYSNKPHTRGQLDTLHKTIQAGEALRHSLAKEEEEVFDVVGGINDLKPTQTKILKPTAYLSGKITGLSIEEYTAKFNAVDELLNNAYVVINPVTLCANLDNTGATWADYMELCCKALFKFKETPKHLTIFMLAGWEDSTGARVEHAIAKELGFRIVYLK